MQGHTALPHTSGNWYWASSTWQQQCSNVNRGESHMISQSAGHVPAGPRRTVQGRGISVALGSSQLQTSSLAHFLTDPHAPLWLVSIPPRHVSVCFVCHINRGLAHGMPFVLHSPKQFRSTTYFIHLPETADKGLMQMLQERLLFHRRATLPIQGPDLQPVPKQCLRQSMQAGSPFKASVCSMKCTAVKACKHAVLVRHPFVQRNAQQTARLGLIRKRTQVKAPG